MDNTGEELLEQTLKQYEEELSVVMSALDADADNQDLIELKTKLIDIIALTEVDLVNVKKAKLLSQLNSSEGPKATTSSSTKESEYNDSDDIGSLIETLNELNGKECRVAFTQQNGSVGYHNGIVMTTEVMDAIEYESNRDLKGLKVKVFFTHPLTKSMLPCPHYLSSKCHYSSDKCKYSHGYEVSLEEVKPFQPKDYSTLGRDSVCLAKSKTDSLWYKAIVDDIRDQQIIVKYCDSDFIDNVDIEDILPLNEDNETKYENNLNETYDKSELSVINWNNSSSDTMAKWEIHTKGIGSKLMTKMGYVMGQGLGRNGEGITNPIDVFVFPTGKSLDACIELREKYLSNDELQQKIRNREKKIENQIVNGYNRVELKDNVFDFINSKIFKPKEDIPEKETKDKGKTISKLKASNVKSLNISSVKISEDIRRAECDLKRMNESISRNKDKSLISHFQEKIDKQKQLITSLKQKESMIQREQKSRIDKQKLTVF